MKKEGERDWIGLLLAVIAIVIFIAVIVMLVWKIMGGSPTVWQIVGLGVGGLGVYALKFHRDYGKFEGGMREFKKATIGSFKNIKIDMGEIKVDLVKVKKDVEYLRRDWKEMRKDIKYLIRKVK